MKKVLIVTYYWPPSGGSGVQRWLKFVKYLPSYGWEPHVFTPENPSFAVIDPSLQNDVPAEAEVIRFPIWEPYDAFFRIAGLFGSKKQATPTAMVSAEKRSAFQAFSTWVRGNFFVPDPRRFWVKPSVKFLSDYLADNHIKTVITTGPPHSVHLIGLKLKSAFPHLRWLADFRDPWSEWGLLDSLMVSGVVRNMHRKLEQKVLQQADEVLTITPFYVRRFEEVGRRKVKLLTNGFDEEDFTSLRYERAGKFIIRHVGIINEKCDPRPFLMAYAKAMEKNLAFAENVQLEFIGEVHPRIQAFIGKSEALRKTTRLAGNIPHKRLLEVYGSSALLLLILTGYKDAEGYLPGKLFEYIACHLPILGVGPVCGDAASVLEESGLGKMYEASDQESIGEALLDSYYRWQSLGKAVPEEKGHSSRYSRRNITGQLVNILETPL